MCWLPTVCIFFIVINLTLFVCCVYGLIISFHVFFRVWIGMSLDKREKNPTRVSALEISIWEYTEHKNDVIVNLYVRTTFDLLHKTTYTTCTHRRLVFLFAMQKTSWMCTWGKQVLPTYKDTHDSAAFHRPTTSSDKPPCEQWLRFCSICGKKGHNSTTGP